MLHIKDNQCYKGRPTQNSCGRFLQYDQRQCYLKPHMITSQFTLLQWMLLQAPAVLNPPSKQINEKVILQLLKPSCQNELLALYQSAIYRYMKFVFIMCSISIFLQSVSK